LAAIGILRIGQRAFTALFVLLVLCASARAEDQHFLRTAFVIELRQGGGETPSHITNWLVVGPSAMLGARLVDRIELKAGLLVLLHYVEVPDAGGPRFVPTFVVDATVDLVKFLRNRGSWFARGEALIGSADLANGNPDCRECGQQLVVGYDFASGVRFALNRNVAMGVEVGTLGDFINPGGKSEQSTFGVYGALVTSFYIGRGLSKP
jgi:hypothetical protein